MFDWKNVSGNNSSVPVSEVIQKMVGVQFSEEKPPVDVVNVEIFYRLLFNTDLFEGTTILYRPCDRLIFFLRDIKK